MSEDMLVKIFELQARFDGELAEKRKLDYDVSTWVQKEVLAMISELGEILDEVNFKWWKDPKEIDKTALTEEIVDVLHFFVSMCLKVGISPEQLFQAYCHKNHENFKRQQGLSEKSGYSWTKSE